MTTAILNTTTGPQGPSPSNQSTPSKEIEAAARRLVSKLDQVDADPQFRSIWVLAAMHGAPYSGPSYGGELAELRSILSAISIGETDGTTSAEVSSRRGEPCGEALSRTDSLGIISEKITGTSGPFAGEPREEELCGEISLEGARLCERQFGHAGPHAYGRIPT